MSTRYLLQQRARRAVAGSFLALALLSAGAVGASAADYTVTNLGSRNSWVNLRAMNAEGEVAYSEYDPTSGKYIAYFHDGTTKHEIGSFGGYWIGPLYVTDSGQVVGYGQTANRSERAFSWTQAGGLVDLGTLGGTYAHPMDVNEAGQVVGRASTAGNSSEHAFSWTQAGGMVDLGTLGGTRSYATDVNEAGQVVGTAYTAENGSHRAFSWTQAGGMVDLGTLGGSHSEVRGVNEAGQVVGYAYMVGDRLFHAFSWTRAGGMVDLGTLGGTDSIAFDVNEAGQVVGVANTTGNNSQHAFSWTRADGMVDLGTLGGSYSYPVDVNESGQVIGYSYTAGNSSFHGFWWTPAGGMVDLTFGGAYSWASDINRSGNVVGHSTTTGDTAYRAFSYTPAGGIVDLNDHLINAPPGLELWYALAVSDNGRIVASGNTGLVLLGGSSTAPVLGPIAANDPAAKDTSVAVSATFTDADESDTHTAVWTWGDGSPSSPGVVTPSSGIVTGAHTFAAAGVYTVSLTLTDNTGGATTVSRDVVVYDPAAGFVTGGGWIMSPPGAFKADETLAGRADFGFVSKYQRGAQVPSGKTEFQFQTANLNFHSDKYDWLVVSGARAQYKGVGTINGQGSYKFLLTAVDGDKLSSTKDRFRIKIWSYNEEAKEDVVTYDNQLESSTVGTTSEGTQIGGGSIVIHSK